MKLIGELDIRRGNGWSLFLDRDGVINKRLPGAYVTAPGEFIFLDGVLDALPALRQCFDRIFIVTNQQGIGKGIMTEMQLLDVHKYMIQKIIESGGRIDAVYYSPFLRILNHPMRKPSPGMALLAREEHPEVDFGKSVMVGDSATDMEFGKNLGMVTVFITNSVNKKKCNADMNFRSLIAFARQLSGKILT